MSDHAEERDEAAAQQPVIPLIDESRKYLDLFVGQVEDYAILLLDSAGHIKSWNAGARRINGYEADDILGRHFSCFYTQEAVAKGWPDYELKMAAKHGRFRDEGWRVRKDGTRFWAGVVITVVRSDQGQGTGFIKITRDLTERRRAEAALRQSEERFRLLVDGVKEYAIYLLSPEGLIMSWNPGAVRALGFSASEVIGRHFSSLYPGDAVASNKPELELRAAMLQGSLEAEGWLMRKDGKRFWANVFLTYLSHPDGRPQGFAVITRDMTDRRRVEELLRSGRQRNEFLSLLTHELRNPLAPIRNALHVMAQRDLSSASFGRIKGIAERQVDNMGRMLDDLLDMTQINQGGLELRRERADLADIVNGAVQAALPQMTERRHRLVVEVPRGSLWVHGDSIRLEQIFINLLINAAKYTEPEGRITVTARRENESAVVRVRDTGIGIDPLMASRIFDLYAQSGRRVDRAAGGVGLGLTLVRRLVELHDGTVEVLSAGRGRGSEFVVSLPAVEPPAATLAVPPGPAQGARACRVLVVDDSIDAADSLALALEGAGQDVRVAYDGESALIIAAEIKPQTVLLDIGMPGMDGYEVARRLRASAATAKSLIIAVTGWGQREDRRRAKEAGFDRHLVKPVDPFTLSQLVAEG